MSGAVVGEIFVGLVVNVKNAVLGAEGVDGAERGGGVDGASGIVGRDGEDRAGARGDRGTEGGEVELVVGLNVMLSFKVIVPLVVKVTLLPLRAMVLVPVLPARMVRRYARATGQPDHPRGCCPCVANRRAESSPTAAPRET